MMHKIILHYINSILYFLNRVFFNINTTVIGIQFYLGMERSYYVIAKTDIGPYRS